MPVKNQLNARVPVKIYTDDVDSASMQQLSNIASLPVVHPHVAAMPDVHAGIGATVGSVIPTRSAVIPAAVGVDIGCGMAAVELSLTASQLPDTLKPLRLAIEDAIPVGFEKHSRPTLKPTHVRRISQDIETLVGKHPGLLKMVKRFGDTWPRQLGTLGGGNHFIELCVDATDGVWLMLHSGSRGVGNAIGRYFTALAKKDMGVHLRNLPDKDLAYLQEGTVHFDDYWFALNWAQDYAALNRDEMLRLALAAMVHHLPAFRVKARAVNCHHNYVARETHFGEELLVTRKGAIRAGVGELGIIPGSMGARSYIVRGKGAVDAFSSCAHGAGRRMSRTAAKRTFTIDDLVTQTKGIECRKDWGVIDEIPGAYKDIDAVMANQTDLVDIVAQLRQVICIKG